MTDTNKNKNNNKSSTLILNFGPSECLMNYVENYPNIKIEEVGVNWCAVSVNNMDEDQKVQFQIDLLNNLVQEVVNQ